MHLGRGGALSAREGRGGDVLQALDASGALSCADDDVDLRFWAHLPTFDIGLRGGGCSYVQFGTGRRSSHASKWLFFGVLTVRNLTRFYLPIYLPARNATPPITIMCQPPEVSNESNPAKQAIRALEIFEQLATVQKRTMAGIKWREDRRVERGTASGSSSAAHRAYPLVAAFLTRCLCGLLLPSVDRGVSRDQEFFDGNTAYNTLRQMDRKRGRGPFALHVLADDAGRFVRLLAGATTSDIGWPGYASQFESCEL